MLLDLALSIKVQMEYGEVIVNNEMILVTITQMEEDIDIFEEIKALLELRKRSNVILTPHNSFNTWEAVERKAQQSVQQVEHFKAENKFLWQVPKRN